MIYISTETDEEREIGFDHEAEIAREVLRDVLGDFFSREDEERHAAAWEASNGRPLKRAWEPWPAFAQRKAEFKPLRPVKEYIMDTPSAMEALDRLIEKARAVPLSPSEQNEAHALEDLLDRPKTDFDKPIPTKEDAELASLRRFSRIQEKSLWIDRVKLVEKENDFGALQFVILRDTREEVRQAAQDRLLDLELAKR